jgi:quercetin dioxygenase-like cupin family protein
MDLHADFSRPAVVHADAADWIASPMPGVARKMLDRIGGEVARATSIVRYDPGSRFSRHMHGGGEEFLVLEGVFQDEHGDYPAGAYLRNPPQSSHTPGAVDGCVILVKLWQFDAGDRLGVRVHADDIAPQTETGRPGVQLQWLHRDAREAVRIETWAAGATVVHAAPGGIEIFVLAGSFDASAGNDHADPVATGHSSGAMQTMRRWSWLRLPPGMPLAARVGKDGARVWIKEGHLAPEILAANHAALKMSI